MTRGELRRVWLHKLQTVLHAVATAPRAELDGLLALRHATESKYPQLRGLGVDSGIFGSPEALLRVTFDAQGATLSRIQRLIDHLEREIDRAEAREAGEGR